MRRGGGLELLAMAAALFTCSCGRSLMEDFSAPGSGSGSGAEPGGTGARMGAGTGGRGGSGGGEAGRGGQAGATDPTETVALCSHGPWAGPGSVALYGRDGNRLYAATQSGSLVDVPFPVAGDQVLGRGSPSTGGTSMYPLESGAVHTTVAHGFTALFADESVLEPSANQGRVKRFAAALFDDAGRLRYAASGEAGGRAYDDTVSALRLEESGTLTVDYRRAADFSGYEPIPDLRLDAAGGEARGYFPVTDADGWARAPFGLYHGATGRRLEAPSTLRLAHGERSELFAVSYVERLGDTSRVTVFDGRGQSSFEVAGTLVEYTESAAEFVAPGVLLLKSDRLPMYRIDLANQRMTPLLADLDRKRLTITDADGTGLGKGTYRVNLYDGSGVTIVDGYLVDAASGTVVRLSAVGASSTASISQGHNVWFVWEAGRLRFGIRRDTGEVVSLPAPPSPSAEMTVFALEPPVRALYLSGGRPWAELDFTTDQLSVIPAAETRDLDAADGVGLHGDFIVGSAAGVPRWFTRDRSGRFERLPSPAELEIGAGASFSASAQTASGSPGRATEWLLVHEGGLPRVALSLPDAEVVRIAPEDAFTLAPADRIEALGEWAFGFVHAPADKAGVTWLDGYRVAWRVHLPSGRVSVVPDIPGYTSLFDERYVIEPGSNLEYYLVGKDFVFSDGTVAAVRRDERAAWLFVLDAASESFAPIGEPFTHVFAVDVRHGAGYFEVTPVELDCYCVEPLLDWGSGEPDTSRQHQLVLIGEDSPSTIIGGGWTFSPDRSCVAVASDVAGSFARDFATGTTTSLPRAASWHWLEPDPSR